MEGPQIRIYADRLRSWAGRRLARVSGDRASQAEMFVGQPLPMAVSYGKRIYLPFDEAALRLHCLMFGDLRFNETRDKRITLRVDFDGGDFFLLTLGAATHVPLADMSEIEPWRDLADPAFDRARVSRDLTTHTGDAAVCDLLLDQDRLPGLGNKIKNEALWMARVHPLTMWRELSSAKRRQVLQACLDFAPELATALLECRKSRHAIYRARKCPRCGTPIEHADLGELNRRCHWCPRCQEKTLPLA